MLRRIFILFLFVFVTAMFLGIHPVYAVEKYTIKEMTSAVQSALENRRNRYGQLEALKRQRKVGENNRGYVEAFSSEGSVRSLVEAENRDRKVIYQTIADQNNLTDALSTIEKVFAQTQRDNAESGDKIQTEDGRWVKK